MIAAHINLAKGFRGGERQTVLLIEYLAKLGVKKQYLVCRNNSPMRELLSATEGLSFIDASHQFAGHFSIANADVVHAHDAKGIHWAWIQKKLKGRPYILTRRIDNPVKNKRFNQITYSQASKRVAISKIIERHLISRNWGEINRVADAFSYLPSDSKQTETLKAQFNNQFLVGHIAALSDHHKGQRILIAAAERLEKSHPNIQFLFYGKGDDEQALKEESKHLSNVHWQGFVNNVGDVIPMFDLFAFPSRMEGLGSTLLDVMYFNVPIIASNVGGIPDIVEHEKTGLLFKNEDDRALAEAILKLYEDREHGQKLALKAKKDLDKYSPEAMAQAYLSLYEQVLNR